MWHIYDTLGHLFRYQNVLEEAELNFAVDHNQVFKSTDYTSVHFPIVESLRHDSSNL